MPKKPTELQELRAELDRLRTLDAHARRLLGGNENNRSSDLIRRAERLLDPEPAGELTAALHAHSNYIKPFIDKNREGAERAEAATKMEEARVKALRDNHHARQAAAMRERAEREQRAVAQSAVDEIIL